MIDLKLQLLLAVLFLSLFVESGHGGTMRALLRHRSHGDIHHHDKMKKQKSLEVAEVVHRPLSKAQRRQLQSVVYCVTTSTNETALQTALDWACGSGSGLGNVDCAAIQEGGSCYSPNSLQSHASYAFDAYYVAQSGASEACNFDGLASTTTVNPSSGTCVYPTLSGTGSTSTSNTTTTPTTSLGPTSSTSNATTFGSPTTGSTSNANIFTSSWATLPYALFVSFFLCSAL